MPERPANPIQFMLLCLGEKVPRLTTATRRHVESAQRTPSRTSFGDEYKRALRRPPSRALATMRHSRSGKLGLTQFVPATLVEALGAVHSVHVPFTATGTLPNSTAEYRGELVTPRGSTLDEAGHTAIDIEAMHQPLSITPFPVVLQPSVMNHGAHAFRADSVPAVSGKQAAVRCCGGFWFVLPVPSVVR